MQRGRYFSISLLFFFSFFPHLNFAFISWLCLNKPEGWDVDEMLICYVCIYMYMRTGHIHLQMLFVWGTCTQDNVLK